MTAQAQAAKKRTATEAFGKNIPVKQYQHAPTPRQKSSSSKVVNFKHDNSDDEASASPRRHAAKIPTATASSTAQHGTAPHNSKSRLKQHAAHLLNLRQKLPIWPHSSEIRQKLKSHDVLLLVGETGSGKSTQIPQFLIPDLHKRKVAVANLPESSSKKNDGKSGGQNELIAVGGAVAVTQPRRVAAISLARRVAEEMGTPLGNSSPASQVGYSVRFDTSVGPNTKVKYLTDGMLLQEILRDPWLREYSVVVVDEVHERGVNVDLVLGFLKRILEAGKKGGDGDGRGGVPLRVVVMSATADMEKVEKFFAGGQDEEEKKDQFELDGHKEDRDDVARVAPKVTSCFIKGRQFPVNIHYTNQPVPNMLDAVMERIMNIHAHTPLPGDVLAFLPGQETIDSLESMCDNYAATLQAQSKQKGAPKLPKLLILPLFAALPTAAQQRVFEPTPPFTRKIILSTNIAETSVTVPGIRHVIDTGKRKARFFRPSLNLDTLLTKAISRSSANQRAGRAGRVAAGDCYRIYPEKTYYELDVDTEPEILRCDLSQVVLTLKGHNTGNVLDFPYLTPPPIKALEQALLHLLRLGALDRQNGQITTVGQHMASLPLPANLARVLLAAQEPQFHCLEEMIDIVSGLSVENIWLSIHNGYPVGSTIDAVTNYRPDDTTSHPIDDDEEKLSPIAQARSTLYRREGDHLTLLAAIQAYTNENTDRKEWCRRHGISHRAMRAAMDVKKQLTSIFASAGRFDPNNSSGKKGNKKATKRQSEDHDESNGTVTPAPIHMQDDQPQTAIATSVSSTTLQLPTSDLPTRILRTLLIGHPDKLSRLSPTSATSSSSSISNKQQQQQQQQIWTGPYTHLSNHKSLQIHPSSVLFSRATRPALIMFSEFVVTTRAYVRCVSEVRGEWVDEGLGS